MPGWLNKVKNIEKIGEGTYGEVYKAYDQEHNIVVAMKKMRFDTDEEGVPSTALREIAILKQLNHPNIVRLFRQHGDSKCIYLEFEYVDQDFKKFMEKRKEDLMKDLNWIKVLLFQMITGVAECHKKMVLHRDLKPQNILIDLSSNVVKVADFGLARVMGTPVKPYTHEVVTLWYRAPEILLGDERYSTKVDMWSLGCIFAEMVRGHPLCPGESEIDQIFKIFQIFGTPDKNCRLSRLPDFQPIFPKWQKVPLHELLPTLGPDGIDLFAKLMDFNPDYRCTADEALSHHFFDSIRPAADSFYNQCFFGVQNENPVFEVPGRQFDLIDQENAAPVKYMSGMC